MYATDMVSGSKPGFMKIGIGVQAILRQCLRNMKGCKVGITETAGIYEVRR
jgi:hypothetical protein